MAYPGIVAFMGVNRPTALAAARNAAKEWANKSEEELAMLLLPECQKISDLMDKAARIDELERLVKNLEWQSSEAAQKNRRERKAAEQRSRDLANRPPIQRDTD